MTFHNGTMTEQTMLEYLSSTILNFLQNFAWITVVILFSFADTPPPPYCPMDKKPEGMFTFTILVFFDCFDVWNGTQTSVLFKLVTEIPPVSAPNENKHSQLVTNSCQLDFFASFPFVYRVLWQVCDIHNRVIRVGVHS